MTGFTRMKAGIQSDDGSKKPCVPQFGSPRRVPSTKPSGAPPSPAMHCLSPSTKPAEERSSSRSQSLSEASTNASTSGNSPSCSK